MQFARDMVLTLLTAIGSFLLGVASSVLTARLLGPEGKGLLTLACLLPALFVSLGSFGLSSANVYLLRRAQAPVGTLLANSLIVAIGSSLLASLAVVVLWPWLDRHVISGVSAGLVVLGMTVLPLALITDYLISLLLGSQRLVRMNVVTILGRGLSLAFLVVALLLFRGGVKGALIAYVLGVAATLGVVVLALRSTLGGGVLVGRADGRSLRRALAYGIREHASNVAMFLSYRIDMFFVAALAGARAVGIYAIAVMLAEMFFYLPNAVAVVLFPRLSGRGSHLGAHEAARTTRVASSLVGVAALLSIPLVRPGIRFAFGNDFVQSVPAFLALLPGIYAMTVSKVISPYFSGTLGRPSLNASAAIVALAVNLPLNVILIPSYGIVGAAIASSAAYTAHALVSLAIFRWHSGLPLSTALLLRGEDLEWIHAYVRALRPLRWCTPN